MKSALLSSNILCLESCRQSHMKPQIHLTMHFSGKKKKGQRECWPRHQLFFIQE